MTQLEPAQALSAPAVHHKPLSTTFHGVQHPLSSSAAELHQFRGIKYASVPARFRRSTIFLSYPSHTDATKNGPIAPQSKHRGLEKRLFGLRKDQYPQMARKQDEFECLNLNITRPGRVSPSSRLPVMVWIHGGGNVGGSGSDWMYDAGHLVLKSMQINKPVIVVSINYRLGLLGFAASNLLRDDNAAAGEDGVGNYGLYDQRTALRWVQSNISAFGGDPDSVTLFGSSAGAVDIHCHLLAAANANAKRPLFHRAILQSGAVTPCSVNDVSTAGWNLSRIMSALKIRTLDELRAVEPEKLVALTGERIRPVDDGVFFRPDWKTLRLLSPSSSVPQDIIIGDCEFESVLWQMPAQLWTTEQVVRRVRAIVQSVYKADTLLRAYDIDGYTPDEEIADRVLELINDAQFAYAVDLAARASVTPPSAHPHCAPRVYRYVFDQASPYTDTPHHAVDLVYLFANIPLPTLPELTHEENTERNWDHVRVCDALQGRWLTFAHGAAPWAPARTGGAGDRVYVFGPEGETGERCWSIFAGRRRVHAWAEALEPLGLHIVQKVGLELGNGPPLGSKARF